MYRDFGRTLDAAFWRKISESTLGTISQPKVKITNVKAFVVQGNFPWTIIEIQTDKDTTGYGEAFPCPGVREIVNDHLKWILLGSNPLNIRAIYDHMAQNLSSFGSQSGIAVIAMSGIEIALCDLWGKLLNVPVYQLLGAKYRDEIQLYADCHAGQPMSQASIHAMTGYSEKEYGNAAMEAVSKGFKIIKFDLDLPSESSTVNRHLTDQEIEERGKIVDHVRNAIGTSIGFAIDLHWNYNIESATRLIKRLEQAHLLWVEDPLLDNFVALRKIATHSRIPILTGENLYRTSAFSSLLEEGLVDFISPDVTKTGGILESLEICNLAERHSVIVCPHNAASPIGTLAAAHVCAAIPNFLALEYHALELEWWERMVKTKQPLIRRGVLSLPDEPGLGVELDKTIMENHMVSSGANEYSGD